MLFHSNLREYVKSRHFLCQELHNEPSYGQKI
jgi:hypothetical protein